MILAYLLLVHLVGDFVLQSKKLVEWKKRSNKGLLVHALTHFVLVLAILLLFLPEKLCFLLLLSLIIGVTHFFIDKSKVKHDKTKKDKANIFIFDQALHLIVIVFLFQLITAVSTPLVIYPKILLFTIYLITAIFSTRVLDIYKMQKTPQFRPSKKSIYSRILIISIIFFLFLLLI